jgi:pilus assembly protein CpaE
VNDSITDGEAPLIPRLAIEAFLLSAETQAALETMGADRRFSKSRLSFHQGGIAAAIPYFAENPTPQVLIVEEDTSDDVLLQNLQGLAEVVEPGVKVVVIGRLNDIDLYRTLITQGVSEYLVAPPTAPQLAETILGLFKDPAEVPRGRTIAFFGARGGVGSSSLAQNVAWCLADALKDSVVLIDLDFSFGTSDLDFNIETKQSTADVLGQWERLDAVLLERFLVAHGDNLRILSNSGNLTLAAPPSADALDKLIDLAGGMAAYVVLDVPHQWTEWTQGLLESADDLVIVARPDLLNLRDCKNLFTVLAARRQASPTRVVLNMMDSAKKTQLSAKDFHDTLNTLPVATIPFEPVLFGEAANNGQMIGEKAKNHRVTQALRDLALRLSGTEVAKRKTGGLADWFAKLAAKEAKPKAKEKSA